MFENEDQEHCLDHEIGSLDMNYGDMSGCDSHEITDLHELIIPLSHFQCPEPDPSHMSHCPEACDVFQTVAQESDHESGEDEHKERQDSIYQTTYIHFEPDVELDSVESDSSESDAKEEAHQPQDDRLHIAEETHSLEKHWELDDLGSRIFSQHEIDNPKAAAYKVSHHITREAFEGLQQLTDSHMDIRSDFIATQVLEQVSKLSPEVYDCCVNSCMCYTGEFAQLTICSVAKGKAR